MVIVQLVLSQCTCIGLASPNCSPMPCLKTLLHVGTTFTIVTFSASRAVGTIDGTLAIARFNFSLQTTAGRRVEEGIGGEREEGGFVRSSVVWWGAV